MRIIGIDQSLNATGIAIYDYPMYYQVPTWEIDTLALKKLQGGERLKKICHSIEDELYCGADLVVMEGYAIAHMSNIPLVELAGAIKYLIAIYETRILTVSPAERIRYATNGEYNTKTQNIKKIVLECARAEWPELSIEDDNQADALYLAEIGRRVLDPDGADAGCLHPERVVMITQLKMTPEQKAAEAKAAKVAAAERTVAAAAKREAAAARKAAKAAKQEGA